MPTNDEHVSGVKISTFPSAQSIDSPDLVTGLKNNNGIVTNINFTFSTILAWVRQRISEFYIPLSARGQANGVASLNESGKVPVGQIPTSNATPEMDGVGGAGSALSYARSDHRHPSDTSKISTSEKGAASGVASLGSDGKVPSAQLPTIPSASSATPQNLGTAAAGSSTDYSRADHVHNKPSAADVGAQPTITASGILKGDGAGGVSAATAGTDYQAPLTIDATPTANSTNPVQSGGVYTDVRTRVPNYGKGQNILRNWYFVGGGTGHGVFPVNQRGATSGATTNNTYSIDGWKWTYGSSPGGWSLVSGGISVSPSSSDSAILFQELGNLDSLLNGENVTASVLYSDGQFYSGSITRNSGTSQIFVSIGGDWVLRMVANSIRLRFTTARTVVAVKLELGTEQTLCHNEGTAEAPVWVLNEIPDYEYELYRCITSTADPSDTYANKSLATEQQLAYVETGTTASRNYEMEEWIAWQGKIYKTDKGIPAGTTFYTTGGNKNLTEEESGGLNSVNSRQALINGNVIFEVSGRTAIFRSNDNVASSTDIRNTIIPQYYRPKNNVSIPIAYYNGSSWVNEGRFLRVYSGAGNVIISNLLGGIDSTLTFTHSVFCATWTF